MVCDILYVFGFSYLYNVYVASVNRQLNSRSQVSILYCLPKVCVSPVKEVVCYLLRPHVIHAQVVSSSRLKNAAISIGEKSNFMKKGLKNGLQKTFVPIFRFYTKNSPWNS